MVKSSKFVSFAVFDMSEINGLRVCIEFCLKFVKNATKTYAMIQTVFGDVSLSRSVTFQWFKRFENGRQPSEDESCFGRPSISRNNDDMEKICLKIRI